MLLKSLFCTHGYDNGPRLLVVSFAFYIAVLLASMLSTAMALVLGIAGIVVLALSSWRRLKAAAHSVSMLGLTLAPSVAFLAFSVLDISIISLVINLLLGVGLTAFVAGLKDSERRVYVMGYAGPALEMTPNVDRMKSRVEPNVRIEPMLSHHSEIALDANASEFQQTANSAEVRDDESQSSTAEFVEPSAAEQQLNEFLLRWSEFVRLNKLPVSIAISVVLIASVGASLWLSVSSDEVADKKPLEPQQNTPLAQTQRVSVKLPDGFALVLESSVTQTQPILVMRWLGDEGQAEQLWSLASAQGDRRCANLTFNDGTQYRPIEVSLLLDSATEARFSPLDTQRIVKDMARRGSVKLCGYNFSLKGSQAAIGRSPEFADILGS